MEEHGLSPSGERQVRLGTGIKQRPAFRNYKIHSFHISSSTTVRLAVLVDVVDEVLDDGGGVGGLHGLAVMGDHDTGLGLDDDNTLLALPRRLIYWILCWSRELTLHAPSCRIYYGHRL
jgi:hypothetical protein